MDLIKKFKSETPRIVGFLQLGLTMVSSISGTLAAAGVIINPILGTVVAITSTIITGLLQFTEKEVKND